MNSSDSRVDATNRQYLQVPNKSKDFRSSVGLLLSACLNLQIIFRICFKSCTGLLAKSLSVSAASQKLFHVPSYSMSRKLKAEAGVSSSAGGSSKEPRKRDRSQIPIKNYSRQSFPTRTIITNEMCVLFATSPATKLTSNTTLMNDKNKVRRNIISYRIFYVGPYFGMIRDCFILFRYICRLPRRIDIYTYLINIRHSPWNILDKAQQFPVGK